MRNLIYLPIFLLIGIIGFVGCIAEKKDIQALENNIAYLRKQIVNLEWKVTLLEISQSSYNTISINPAEKGFQRIDTSSGFFLISCVDAKPFLGGYKFILHIGNPSSATYNGFTLNAKWGKKFDFKQTSLNYDDWKKSLQEKVISYVEDLAPGSWNKIELILSPTKPEELEHIELTMQTNKLSLLERRGRNF
jgi:hypothetical protein